MVVGCAGLLLLKARSDREPADPEMIRTDVVFHMLLLWTNLTGLALLGFRDSAAMGSLLAIHLGAVAGFFLTLPYGKFAHVAYRYPALLRNALEAAIDGVGSSDQSESR